MCDQRRAWPKEGRGKPGHYARSLAPRTKPCGRRKCCRGEGDPPGCPYVVAIAHHYPYCYRELVRFDIFCSRPRCTFSKLFCTAHRLLLKGHYRQMGPHHLLINGALFIALSFGGRPTRSLPPSLGHSTRRADGINFKPPAPAGRVRRNHCPTYNLVSDAPVGPRAVDTTECPHPQCPHQHGRRRTQDAPRASER